MSPHRDSPDPENIQSLQDFVRFVNTMSKDVEAGAGYIENSSLSAFLECMAACFRDNGEARLSESGLTDTKVLQGIAQALLMGATYE